MLLSLEASKTLGPGPDLDVRNVKSKYTFLGSENLGNCPISTPLNPSIRPWSPIFHADSPTLPGWFSWNIWSWIRFRFFSSMLPLALCSAPRAGPWGRAASFSPRQLRDPAALLENPSCSVVGHRRNIGKGLHLHRAPECFHCQHPVWLNAAASRVSLFSFTPFCFCHIGIYF